MKSKNSLLHSVLMAVGKFLPFGHRFLKMKGEEYERRALKSYFEGNQSQAIERYEEAIAWLPEDASLHSALGQIYYEQEQYEEAIKQFKAALEWDYSNQRAIRGLAFSLDLSRNPLNYPEAVYWYLRALNQNDEDSDVLFNLGVLLHEMERYTEAIEYYQRAEKLEPHNELIQENLARTFLSLGRFVDAITSFRRALEIEPENAELHELLGVALQATGRKHEAVGSYKLAIEHDPESAEALLDLAQLLGGMNNFEEAIKYATQALQASQKRGDNKTRSGAYWELGWLYYLSEEWQNSIDASREALKTDPDQSPARFNLALALLHDGQPTEARNEYQEGIRRLSELSDLTSHAINDLEEALRKRPALAGGPEILQMLKDEYASRMEASQPSSEGA